MFERFAEFLASVPFSAVRPGFERLIVRALGPGETSVSEQDWRAKPLDSAQLIEVAAEYAHADAAYETRAYWDLWVPDASGTRWERHPQPLEIYCRGEEYDEGAWEEQGHAEVDIGFEHVFTGHAGLLSGHGQTSAPQHPAEADFLARMAVPENLRLYRERTRENIRKLYDWIGRVQNFPSCDRCCLWSEGEENLEARLEEILALR